MPESSDSELPDWLKAIENPQFRDEALAPDVDRDLLRALVRRELSEDAARQTYALIYSFRSWYDAHTEVLIEEWPRGPSDPDDSDTD